VQVSFLRTKELGRRHDLMNECCIRLESMLCSAQQEQQWKRQATRQGAAQSKERFCYFPFALCRCFLAVFALSVPVPVSISIYPSPPPISLSLSWACTIMQSRILFSTHIVVGTGKSFSAARTMLCSCSLLCNCSDIPGYEITGQLRIQQVR
jgi:hypothetical protein